MVKPSSTRDPTKALQLLPSPYQTKFWKSKQAPTSVVYGEMNQVSDYNLWNPECSACHGDGCGCGKCSAFTSWRNCGDTPAAPMFDATGQEYIPEGKDYTSFRKTCCATCPDRPMCSRPNILSCYLGEGSEGEEPTFRADWSGDKKLKCTYDLTKIDTLNQVMAYKEKFNPDPNSDYSWFQIMSNFASQPSSSCLVDPTEDKQIKNCCRITATFQDQNAQLARFWYENLNNQNRDAFIAQYCGKNPNNVECKCELRANDPKYQEIKKYITTSQPISDKCIYVPCKGGTPAFFVNSVDENAACPSQLCQIVYNLSDVGGEVVIQNNQNYLTCKLQSDSNYTPDPIPVVKPDPTKEPIVQKPNQQDYNKTIAYILIIVLVCIILYFLIK